MHTENSMQLQQLKYFSQTHSSFTVQNSTHNCNATENSTGLPHNGIRNSVFCGLLPWKNWVHSPQMQTHIHPQISEATLYPAVAEDPDEPRLISGVNETFLGSLGSCELEGRVDVVRLVLKDSRSGNVEHFPGQESLHNASPHPVCTVIRGGMRKGVSPYRCPLWFCICCPQDTLILLPSVSVVHLSPDDSNPYEAGSAGSSKAHSGLAASMLLQNTSCKRPLISQIPSFPLPKHRKEIHRCIIGSSFDLRHHEKKIAWNVSVQFLSLFLAQETFWLLKEFFKQALQWHFY